MSVMRVDPVFVASRWSPDSIFEESGWSFVAAAQVGEIAVVQLLVRRKGRFKVIAAAFPIGGRRCRGVVVQFAGQTAQH